MNDHLSRWDQEEYVLGQRTPAMIEHIQKCEVCSAEIVQLENGISLFRDSAVAWSAQSLAERPPARLSPIAVTGTAARSWSWPVVQLAAAAMLLLALFIVHPWSRHALQQKAAARHTEAISDDALLQQVDDQLYAAVPTSMESLTHLVSTDPAQSTNQAQGVRSRQHVQTN